MSLPGQTALHTVLHGTYLGNKHGNKVSDICRSGHACPVTDLLRFLQGCQPCHHVIMLTLQMHWFRPCSLWFCLIAGSLVKAGQKLAVLSAMKMETAVQSPCDGLVRHVGVDKGDSLEAGTPASICLAAMSLTDEELLVTG